MRAGRGPANLLLAVVGAGLLSLVVSFVSIARNFEGGITWEFCHYAEIGRNLLEGRGYRTKAVTPFALALLDERGIAFDDEHPAPVLDRFPLQAALSAAAEWLCGKDDAAIATLSAILLACCSAATVLAGAYLFGLWEGAAAGCLLALNPSFQRGFVLWGLPDFGFLLATLAWTVALSIEPKSSKRASAAWGAVAGALAGVAWLARSNFVLWLPLAAWALRRFPARWKAARAAAFVAAFVLVSAPGWAYNLRWYGSVNPPTLAWNLAHQTLSETPPWLSYRVVTTAQVLRGHLPALLRKFCGNLILYIKDAPSLWQLPLAWPFAIYCAWLVLRPGISLSPAAGEGDSAQRWTRLIIAMLAIQVIAFSFLRYESLGAMVKGRYLLWFAPAALILAAHCVHLLGRRWRVENAARAAFLGANAALFVVWLASPQGASAHPGRLPASQWYEFRAIADVPRRGLIASNLPTQVAWYSRRAAVALPATPEDLRRIAQRHQVAALHISRLPIGELRTLPAWDPYLRPRDESPAALREIDERWRNLGYEVDQRLGAALLLKPIR